MQLTVQQRLLPLPWEDRGDLVLVGIKSTQRGLLAVAAMLNNPMWVVGPIIVAAIVFFAIWKLDALSFIYDIKIAEDSIEFVLFSFLRVYKLPFSEIEYVKKTKGGYAIIAYNFKNRLFHTTFLIKKKRGFFTQKILVTPSNADTFENLLNKANVHVIK